MRRLALIIATALSACAPCWAAFTSPPWPSGTNYYIAGTNKDNRIRQIEQGINERELVLGISNSPSTTAQFYTHEREYCIEAKGWIAAHAGDFVDYTRTTSSNITYWAVTNLISDCGLPTNFFSYTPWQALNGVGYGYTNEYTASNYTTLAYGYAGLTNLMKRFVQIVRTGTWAVAASTNIYGRAWSLTTPFEWNNGGEKNDCLYHNDIQTDCGIYALWDNRSTAISESLAGASVEVFTYDDPTTNYADTTYASVTLPTLTNYPPVAFAAIFRTVAGETFSNNTWSAHWGVTAPANSYVTLSSTYLPAWRLYVKGGMPIDPLTESLDPDFQPNIQFDAFSTGISNGMWSVVQTGIVASGSTVVSGPVGLSNMVMDASMFQADTNLSLMIGSYPVISVVPPRGGEVDAIAYGGSKGFTVSEWVFVLDYGATNGFLRK